MTKKELDIDEFSGLEIIGEPLISAAVAFLGIVPIAGASASAGLSAWQNKNFQKFARVVKQRFERIERSTIDRDFVESDEFKGLIVQSIEAASYSASERRREALAGALLESCTLSKSKLGNKQTIIRALSQMSDDEIIALKVLYRLEQKFDLFERKPTDVVTTQQMSEEIHCGDEETKITCDGLLQLGLAYDAEGQYFDSTGQHRQIWRITSLGNRIVEYAMSGIMLDE